MGRDLAGYRQAVTIGGIVFGAVASSQGGGGGGRRGRPGADRRPYDEDETRGRD